MVNKENYLSQISTLKNIAEKYDIYDAHLDKLEKCVSDITDFSLKVLFVGAFSAGKSALINAILDRDLLTEDQKPETAIACEITFDEEEYVELIDKEGNRSICSLDDIYSYDPVEYSHFTYHLNSEYLKRHPDYTMVDMPGFNSGIEEHNKAIMQYAGQGNAYVLVIDCEDGEIKSSAIDFLKEIKQYEDNLAIVISKSDKKPEKHVLSISDKIKDTATLIFNKDLAVVTTSKFEESIEDKMNTVLGSFDPQSLFEQKFAPRIFEVATMCYAALESISKASEFDDDDIEKEIYKRQKAKNKLSEQLAKERKKLSFKMKNQVKPSIINDMQNALYANSAPLASSLMSGGDNFSRTVNNVLRPVLISSTQRYAEESFFEFVEQMNLFDILAEDNSQQFAEDISQKYFAVSLKLDQILANSDKENAGKFYKTIIGALAITTSFVAPWIELILVFLPDILKVFSGLNQSSQMDSLRKKVENEIIPQIISKMEPEIETSLQILEEEMLEGIDTKINELMDIETEALNAALSMREFKQEEYEMMLKNIEDDKENIKEIISLKK